MGGEDLGVAGASATSLILRDGRSGEQWAFALRVEILGKVSLMDGFHVVRARWYCVPMYTLA